MIFLISGFSGFFIIGILFLTIRHFRVKVKGGETYDVEMDVPDNETPGFEVTINAKVGNSTTQVAQISIDSIKEVPTDVSKPIKKDPTGIQFGGLRSKLLNEGYDAVILEDTEILLPYKINVSDSSILIYALGGGIFRIAKKSGKTYRYIDYKIPYNREGSVRVHRNMFRLGGETWTSYPHEYKVQVMDEQTFLEEFPFKG